MDAATPQARRHGPHPAAASHHQEALQQPQGKSQPHTTPFTEEKSILGVTYGVLLWADTNAATPLGAWACSVMSLGPQVEEKPKAEDPPDREHEYCVCLHGEGDPKPEGPSPCTTPVACYPCLLRRTQQAVCMKKGRHALIQLVCDRVCDRVCGRVCDRRS